MSKYTEEIEVEDVDYDTGYGEQNGILVVEVEVTEENADFDHAFGTKRAVSYEAEIKDATLFLYGNNGIELGEVEFNGKVQEIVKYCDESEVLERAKHEAARR